MDDSRICRKLTIESFRRELKLFSDEYDLVHEECEDGVDSVNTIMKGNTFDVICMDNVMTKMDGPQATRSIRSLGYSGKIIAITGNVFKEDVDIFMTSGVDFVFPKPVNRSEIQDLIKNMLQV